MTYKLTKNNLHIEDSYAIGKRVMQYHLNAIQDTAKTPTKVWNRSMFSLCMEWVCHNFLYSVGLWRSRTKDVDLDNPCDKPEWMYIVLGCLVWIFVK